MKTPREILLKHHRPVEAKLDSIREKAVAGLTTATGQEPVRHLRSERGALLRKVWLELVWPCRRAWAGIAVLWLAVATANLAMKAPAGSAAVARSTPGPNVVQALDEQRRLLAELLPPIVTTPQVKRKEPVRQPRSQRDLPFKACKLERGTSRPAAATIGTSAPEKSWAGWAVGPAAGRDVPRSAGFGFQHDFQFT